MHACANIPLLHPENQESAGCIAIQTMPSRNIEDSDNTQPHTEVDGERLYVSVSTT